MSRLKVAWNQEFPKHHHMIVQNLWDIASRFRKNANIWYLILVYGKGEKQTETSALKNRKIAMIREQILEITSENGTIDEENLLQYYEMKGTVEDKRGTLLGIFLLKLIALLKLTHNKKIELSCPN